MVIVGSLAGTRTVYIVSVCVCVLGDMVRIRQLHTYGHTVMFLCS